MPKNTYDDKDTPEIPGYVFTDLADCLLPLMQEFFQSDEGSRPKLTGGRSTLAVSSRNKKARRKV